MGRWTQPLFTLGLLGAVSFGLWRSVADGWNANARLFPWFVGSVAVVLLLVRLTVDVGLALWDVRANRRVVPAGHVRTDPDEETSSAEASAAVDAPAEGSTRQVLIALAWAFGFLFGVLLLGFTVSVPVFVLLYLRFKAGASILMTLLVTGGLCLVLFGVLGGLLGLSLPGGYLDLGG
jgi:hypothetical protein